MTPTDPTDTTPAQEAVAAPPAPEATGMATAPPRVKRSPGRDHRRPKRAKSKPKAKAPPDPTKPDRRRIGAPAREEAYRMIAEGVALRAVARALKITLETVMAWRDSPEGKARLEELAKKRDQELGAVQRKARLKLEELIPRAVLRLGDALESANMNVVVRAAAQILDRGGLPRTEVHEEHTGELDLSGLTPEELDQLRALHAKAARGAA